MGEDEQDLLAEAICEGNYKALTGFDITHEDSWIIAAHLHKEGWARINYATGGEIVTDDAIAEIAVDLVENMCTAGRLGPQSREKAVALEALKLRRQHPIGSK
ncbi:hypothetical protein [Mycobacteroides chelonae]|uniref:hypothetical protein n=1 Tax=Mycobacteroides chelonae TaxID=1774 RepID=UPI0008A9CE36|nr:hypothetical protein [Mycobacteroides chelonae]OHT47930.1 hypothetical protein BKG63_24210 [Mycobacteroides chelonae]OHT90690.1 hypothetical protein BKG71_25735 [Mycobacteroides chelonae]OHT99575.1 hypothetical protein BKG72_03880 [Mycobacteroides chelonae]OLT92892.1 hypothetical protein BKG59_05500 [Mycobacteroides chelonae]